jgi:hypothetical protein
MDDVPGRSGARMTSRRARLTYANVAATLALVFSMGGGALAASHYLITSTAQIMPSVLRAMRAGGTAGAKGATGATGAKGAAGAPGTSGARGATGPTGSMTTAAGGVLTGNYPDPSLAALPAETTISAFTNGWSSAGSTPAVGYFRDALGIVHLEGAIAGGEDNHSAFALPAGFRGAGWYSAANPNGTAATDTGTPCEIHIDSSSGDVVPGDRCSTVSGSDIDLDGITFAPTG